MTTNIIIDPVTEDIVIYVNEGVADGVTLNGVQTVTNKTFPSPKITGALLDTNGNELLKVTATASAVNELTLANAATAGAPSLTASGDDTNIDINLVPKGTGKVKVSGVPLLSSIATNKLTGRSTAGTGAVEEISVGSGLILSAGTLSAAAGSSNLNGITAATASATLANGNNPIAWNWTQTTATQTGFEIGETTASTGGVGNQVLHSIKTLAASTADPLLVQTRGVDTIRVSRTGTVDIVGLNGTTGSGTTGSGINITGGQGASTNNGGSVSITSGTGGATSGNSGALQFLTATPGNGASGGVTLKSGTGNGGASGAVTIGSGTSTTTSGNVSIEVGSLSGPGVAGILNILGGSSRAAQSGNSGGVVITGGAAGAVASVAGGPVVITGGAGSATTTGGVGGAVTITAGSGGLAAAGGNLSLLSGSSTSGAGGNVNISTGGSATSGSGNVTIQTGGTGSSSAMGNVQLTGGTNTSSGAGGSVNINAGSSVGGTAGIVQIAAGTGASSGGNILLLPGTGANPGMVKMGPSSLNVGYLEIPQNSQSAAYTLVLTDSGKHILHPSADTTARTFTIPANASVAYPIGTAITFVNQNAAGVVTIAITTDTMRLAGAGTTGSRTLAANGVATAIKLTATEWIISGTGIT